MQKLLPRGFTLIELLVTISIIAILSVIAVSVYGNAQKTARDGVRRTEITSLAKSIEGARDFAGGTYTYGSTQYAADYPQKKPVDPLKTAAAPQYCVAWGLGAATTPPTDPATWVSTSPCPSDVATATQSTWNQVLVNDSASFVTAITSQKYWKICTKLEATTLPYCVGSIQQ